MSGRLGTFLFGCTEFLRRVYGGSRIVACVGDGGTHSGSIITSGQSGNKLYVNGIEVAVDGATFDCDEHGVQSITPIIRKTYRGGKLLITHGAVTGCGAMITPLDRKFYAG